MLGKPKYKRGDKVKFSLMIEGENLEFTGTVEIIDSYGTFEYPDDVSYDIMVEDFPGLGQTLCKHIPESYVTLV